MNYKNPKDENLSADDEKIRATLRSLKRVGTPADFDFHLKSLIARRALAARRSPRFVPQTLRYVLSLGLVILVSAFVVFNGVYFRDEQSIPPIAETRVQNPPPANNSNKSAALTAKVSGGSSSAAPPETARDSDSVKNASGKATANSFLVAVASGAKRKSKIPRSKAAEENLGGSRTIASTGVTRIITPPGISPNRTTSASPNADGGKSLTAKEVLLQLGVEAVFERDAWRVKSVVSNSLAQRSGVRAGDAVEAIDDERLTEKPLKNKTVEGKKLTVARGAEKVEILLVNKSN